MEQKTKMRKQINNFIHILILFIILSPFCIPKSEATMRIDNSEIDVFGTIWGEDYAGWGPDNTIDDDLSTYWHGTNDIQIGWTDFLAYHFSSPYRITMIDFFNDRPNRDVYCLGELDIQISEDSTNGLDGNWITIAHIDGDFDPPGGDFTILIDIVSTSWIRLWMTYQGRAATGITPAFFLSEIVFYYESNVDYDGNGKVDLKDFSKFAQSWGEVGTAARAVDIAPSPLGDRKVDFLDLAVFCEFYLQENGLIAHWELDETKGTVAPDVVSGYNGILHENPVWRPDEGKLYGALLFDGRDDYVSTPFVWNPADGPFSAFAWIKRGGLGEVIISQANGRTWLGIDSLEKQLMTGLTSGSRRSVDLVSESTVSENQWHNIGVVWDGAHRHLHLDGKEVAKDDRDLGKLSASDGGLYFGAGTNLVAGSFWSGLIDDIRIYDRALSAGEIAARVCRSAEDFETGDFSRLPWEHSGDESWVVTSRQKHSGTCSAKAGTIEDGGNTTLQVTVDCVSPQDALRRGNITFYRKVSSETGCDYLQFYIDGVEMDKWSGEEDWAEVSFPVTAGTRTFEWTYSKDGSESVGGDTAWIDDILFPIDLNTE